MKTSRFHPNLNVLELVLEVKWQKTLSTCYLRFYSLCCTILHVFWTDKSHFNDRFLADKILEQTIFLSKVIRTSATSYQHPYTLRCTRTETFCDHISHNSILFIHYPSLEVMTFRVAITPFLCLPDHSITPRSRDLARPGSKNSFCDISRKCILPYMIGVVTRLHSNGTGQFSPKMKANAKPRLLSS